MSDVELTAAEWRMCRQAGAAFAQEDATEVQTKYGQQLMFGQLGPAPGELYRNTHTGAVGTIVGVRQDRRCWVTVRHDGRRTEIPLDWLGVHWVPCRPDGSLR